LNGCDHAHHLVGFHHRQRVHFIALHQHHGSLYLMRRVHPNWLRMNQILEFFHHRLRFSESVHTHYKNAAKQGKREIYLFLPCPC
jgi:hypothetical protein